MSNKNILLFGVGDRVSLNKYGLAGTIVGFKLRHNQKQYRILPDWSFIPPLDREELSRNLGPGITEEKILAILPKLEANYRYVPLETELVPVPEQWEQSPFFLGVYNTESEQVGRPEKLTQALRVKVRSTKGEVFEVPRENAMFCILGNENSKIVLDLGHLRLHAKNLMPFTKEEEEYAPGQKLVFIAKGIRYSNGHLFPEDLLEFLGQDGDHLVVKPLGEPKLEVCLRVSKKAVRSFPYPWIKKGSRLTIKEGVIFRKKDLQGKRAKALTHTDSGGDVGLQFEEDIGAGSLDGLGEDGKCLYLPAEKVTPL